MTAGPLHVSRWHNAIAYDSQTEWALVCWIHVWWLKNTHTALCAHTGHPVQMFLLTTKACSMMESIRWAWIDFTQRRKYALCWIAWWQGEFQMHVHIHNVWQLSLFQTNPVVGKASALVMPPHSRLRCDLVLCFVFRLKFMFLAHCMLVVGITRLRIISE